MRVLVMSEGLQGALACIQSIGRLGHSVTLLVGSRLSPMARSRYVSKLVRAIASEDSNLGKARALVAIVRGEKIEVVIPVSDDDARVVAEAHAHYPDISAFVIPSAASVGIASDKILTLELARKLGIATPSSVVVQARAEVPNAVALLGLPLVVKVPVSTASQGTFVIRTRGEAKRIVERLPDGPLLLQEFVEGTFAGVTGFAVDGELLEWFAFRVPPEMKMVGTSAYAFSDNDPGLLVMLQSICRELKWTGGIDLDALRGSAGQLVLLEINPRFSGTLVFADRLGIDLPRYYPDLVRGAGYQRMSARPPPDVLFVSVAQEAALIATDPRKMQRRAAALRRAHRFVDSGYPDDHGMVAAQSVPARSDTALIAHM